MSGEAFAEASFVVAAPRRRVWDLLGAVALQQLPFEQVDIVSASRFSAVLRWTIGFLSIPLSVEGRLVDMIRDSSYGCVLTARRGPLHSQLRVSMTLKATAGDQTEVTCAAIRERQGGLIGWLISGLQRDFALRSFEAIGARLQWLCSG